MPYDEFEADDPLELVGCEVPLEDDHFEEMAECFVEEFARMGYSAEALFSLFGNPFYRGPHTVYQVRGDGYVRELIARVTGTRPGGTFPHTGLVSIQPLPSSGKE